MSKDKVCAQLGFLATGDELIAGDVLNSNTAEMARILLEHRVDCGMQCVVSDDQLQIHAALSFLFAQLDIVIMTGGLGPTSDDVTRFAVADYFNVELQFHQPSWQRIVTRLSSRGISVTENNRQQCLFPPQAKILRNTNGTADGCMLTAAEKCLVMLPGPPRECVPLFQEQVLPLLLQRELLASRYLHRWLLMGIGESSFAAQFEPLLADSSVEVGYRVCFPYLEIKFLSESECRITALESRFEQVFSDHIVSRGNQKASDLLRAWLLQNSVSIGIQDTVTAGALMSTLCSPTNKASLDFEPRERQYDYHFTVSGLQQYWTQKDVQKDSFVLTCSQPTSQQIEQSVFLRGARTIEWVSEFCCWKIWCWLTQKQA